VKETKLVERQYTKCERLINFNDNDLTLIWSIEKVTFLVQLTSKKLVH